ncbi:MAG: hypothetical protein CL862_11405 [Cyanobium sp. NAT70]|nr:hypothetical protein [Cyanobium sp. NAT70]
MSNENDVLWYTEQGKGLEGLAAETMYNMIESLINYVVDLAVQNSELALKQAYMGSGSQSLKDTLAGGSLLPQYVFTGILTDERLLNPLWDNPDFWNKYLEVVQIIPSDCYLESQ